MLRLGINILKTLESCTLREYGIFCNDIQQIDILAKTLGPYLSTTYLTHYKKSFSQVSRIKPTSQTQTEQEFLVHLKNDPDIFGNGLEQETVDPMDLKEIEHFEQQASPSKKLQTKQYAEIIKSYIKKRKIKEAIDVLEVKMQKEDQVKPENYIYNLILGACGRVGYTKKAFSLYNQMKKCGLKVTGGTYTALFNACANSPWPEDGLSRAQHLQNIMREKMYEPNETNYNSMIKAFGRCGDLPTAFQLVDEMVLKKYRIRDETINFLLQACIQDKEAGFRHALLVWRKVVEKGITPSIYTYNLMLRSVRDCGIGDVDSMNDAINQILSQSVRSQINSSNNKLLLECVNMGKLIQCNKQLHDVLSLCQNSSEELLENQPTTDLNRPNLMAIKPHMGNVISVTEITKAEDRLLLVGGLKGFLHDMVENNCSPDVKTFTQLLDCLPGSIRVEQELQKMMRKFKVKPDIDFFNMLIKKRSMRFDYASAKTVVGEMESYNYKPNLITFGVLSLGCKTKDEGLELLQEMKRHSYRLNTEILGTMLNQACHHKNFPYVLEIMEISLRENVKPNKKFLQHLHNFKKNCKTISNDKKNKLYENTFFQKGFRIFQMRYKTWLEEVEVDETEEVHPWQQYRQTTETDTRHYKDKSQSFKPKHTSRFKVKTSTIHK